MSPIDFTARRRDMVDKHVKARGVRSPLVLDALRAVARERFLPKALHEFAYDDAPLPISGQQTVAQPYTVALLIEALQLKGGEKVLEIGTGCGYAAAVLSHIAGEVYTIERLEPLAAGAAELLAALGCSNVQVRQGDGTLGWPEHAPYDAIVVAAGGPDVPEALKAQLAIGGRLVIPIGIDSRVQELVRLTRESESHYRSEDLADVRFVPLVGEEGWAPDALFRPKAATTTAREAPERRLSRAIADACEPFADIASADLAPLLRRIGNARVVLLGEATHGSAEFYRMRERISRALIEEKGFSFIAIEGDWPDAARVDHYVRHAESKPSEWTAFARFPLWMWRNEEVREFVDWLRARNAGRAPAHRVAFHGLDLYSLFSSIRSVLEYLGDVDPEAAGVARRRYGCLTPWQSDPATYGQAALSGGYPTCEREVVTMLVDLLDKRSAYARHDGARFLDAMQNARLIANAERYYRIMYYGSRASWNLRDSHMFETLQSLLDFHGPASKAIVWAHNSHVGDSAATEMAARGEYNLGHLCRDKFAGAAYAIGFGTDHGSVAASSEWDGPMETKRVRAALPGSHERLCHDSGVPRFLLPLRPGLSDELARGLAKARLERAIGVIYRPETELDSHYFQAVLPRQFDEFVWFDETRAVTPLDTKKVEGLPQTYPFGV